MSIRLTVLGNINIDFVLAADRLPQPGETVRGQGDFSMVAGGKAGNQAVAAARLGAQVNIIGRVGDDAFGPALVENFRRENINANFVKHDNEATTGAAFITVLPDGQNSIISVLGANLRCTEAQVEAAAGEIERSDLLLVQLGVPPQVVDRAIQIAVDRDVPVQLNPSPLGAELPQLWRHVHIILPNEIEATGLTGIEVSDVVSAMKAGESLRAMGIRVAVVTLGATGCVVVGDEGSYLVGGYQVVPVDTTAAGDSFAAALATGIGEGLPTVQAAAFANAAGALTTTMHGAQPSLPRRDKVETFLSECGGLERAEVEQL